VPQASGWGHAGDTCGWWCQLGARRARGRLRFAGGAAGAGRVGGTPGPGWPSAGLLFPATRVTGRRRRL